MEEKIILECYQCSTQFKVSPSLLGLQGKKVRCARCKHEWIAKAPLEKPTTDGPILHGQPALASFSQDTDAANLATPKSDEDLQPILPGSASSLLAESAKKEKLFYRAPLETQSNFLSALFLLLILLFGVPIFLYLGRYKIVELVPYSRNVYTQLGIHTGEDLRAFSLSSLTYTQALQNGITTIIVHGDLKNTSKAILKTPNVVINLYGTGTCPPTTWKDKLFTNDFNHREDGHCILERWSVQTNDAEMLPNQTIAIETSRRIDPKWQIKNVFLDLVRR